MLFPLLMTMSIVALVVIAIKQWNTNEKVKKIEKILKYYIDGKENKNKETKGKAGNDSGGH